jgi:TonB family protein
MTRPGVRFAAATLVALFVCGCAVFARVVPARADNPFCAASVVVYPWDADGNVPAALPESANYLVRLSADGKRSVTARITFIADDGAYTATVTNAPLNAQQSGDAMTAPYLVHFEKAVDASVAFVDGVSVDGAEMTTCPSFVQNIDAYKPGPGDPATLSAPARDAHVTGAFLQDLPAQTCAKSYTPPEMKKSADAIVGEYGNVARDTDVHVFIDSNGNVVRTEVYRSSGVEGLDDAALGAAQATTFKPATFLCIPVVSDFIMTVQYAPN